MKIIKRNGSEVTFDKEKIIKAISKANCAVTEESRMTEKQIERIAHRVVLACEN
ncbi:MAG: ATP cone domain-containing protein, partial [Clostridia bacterium]|nr:ATP cone domain-containing protein [Clostridia bacterium]